MVNVKKTIKNVVAGLALGASALGMQSCEKDKEFDDIKPEKTEPKIEVVHSMDLKYSYLNKKDGFLNSQDLFSDAVIDLNKISDDYFKKTHNAKGEVIGYVSVVVDFAPQSTEITFTNRKNLTDFASIIQGGEKEGNARSEFSGLSIRYKFPKSWNMTIKVYESDVRESYQETSDKNWINERLRNDYIKQLDIIKKAGFKVIVSPESAPKEYAAAKGKSTFTDFMKVAAEQKSRA